MVEMGSDEGGAPGYLMYNDNMLSVCADIFSRVDVKVEYMNKFVGMLCGEVEFGRANNRVTAKVQVHTLTTLIEDELGEMIRLLTLLKNSLASIRERAESPQPRESPTSAATGTAVTGECEEEEEEDEEEGFE